MNSVIEKAKIASALRTKELYASKDVPTIKENKIMMTADEKKFLQDAINSGQIPTCPIRAGERIDFSPNSIKLENAPIIRFK